MNIKIQTLFVILFLSIGSHYLQGQVSIKKRTVKMPSYTVAQPEKSPIFFRNETYQGASRHYYPLKLNDQYTHERILKKWDFIVLENPYIELAIAPQIGGKLYYALDKTNGYNFVYRNNVVKPSNVGMTGAWVSGGIEWCVLHHHRASTFLPINHTISENPDGSKTIWIAEHEPRHGMRWTIGITAFPDRSYFKTEGRVYNASPVTHSFLYWANVAAHTNESYQTVFPPSANVITYHSKTDFARWPISKEKFQQSDFTSGVDISRWKNVEKSNSFFVYNLQEDFMGGFDHAKNAGTVHIGNHHIVKGAKLWEWGSGERGQATEGLLTETDGPYVEIMVGAYSDNQPDYSWIKPGEVKTWEQYWYPVRDIRGFKNASTEGAVNIEKVSTNTLFLGYYTTRKIENARVVLKQNNKTIYEKTASISPEKPFTETIIVQDASDLSLFYTELIDAKDNKTILSYQSPKTEVEKDLPKTWKGYPSPETLGTVEELFLTGQRVEQFYAPRHNAMDWYAEALKKDTGDSRTNTAMGKIYLKNGDYVRARAHFAKAIERLTDNYTRPADCEALYLQGIVLKELELFEEAADTLYRATWDYDFHSPAYYQLAQLSIKNENYAQALEQVKKSLSTNVSDNKATALKAAIERKLHLYADAAITLALTMKTDPLDFRIGYEYYLMLNESGDTEAANYLSKMKTDMRNFYDNYLEVAVSCINDGLLQEAQDILQQYPATHPLIDYYLGYILHKKNDYRMAKQYFDKAATQSIDYVFPYRLRTLNVLDMATKYNPDDANAYYYKGMILYEKQPDMAMQRWSEATDKNPSLSMAYRNLGWGYYYHLNDVAKAIDNYEKAVALNKTEALFFAELDALYEQSNAPVKKRLQLFSGNEPVLANRDDAFIRHIDVLTLADKPEESVKLLDGVTFAYREGTSRNRDIIINAHLMLGKKQMARQNHDEALQSFKNALVQEEEAGNARLGNRDIQVNYYIGLAYEALKQADEAAAYFIKSAAFSTNNSAIMDYYKGLSLMKIGKNIDALQLFESMVANADKEMNENETVDGATFAHREAENIRKSINLTVRGLGYKGLGETEKAHNDLQQAVNYSESNLWAREELRM